MWNCSKHHMTQHDLVYSPSNESFTLPWLLAQHYHRLPRTYVLWPSMITLFQLLRFGLYVLPLQYWRVFQVKLYWPHFSELRIFPSDRTSKDFFYVHRLSVSYVFFFPAHHPFLFSPMLSGVWGGSDIQVCVHWIDFNVSCWWTLRPEDYWLWAAMHVTRSLNLVYLLPMDSISVDDIVPTFVEAIGTQGEQPCGL